jgi:hypothetical protein
VKRVFRHKNVRHLFAIRFTGERLQATTLTIAQLLEHVYTTQILPTYVKPLDENTKAVIEGLDVARLLQSSKLPSVQ